MLHRKRQQVQHASLRKMTDAIWAGAVHACLRGLCMCSEINDQLDKISRRQTLLKILLTRIYDRQWWSITRTHRMQTAIKIIVLAKREKIWLRYRARYSYHRDNGNNIVIVTFFLHHRCCSRGEPNRYFSSHDTAELGEPLLQIDLISFFRFS